MRGTAIFRDLRRISTLPLRRETIWHIALNPEVLMPPGMNRLMAADPGLALGVLMLVPRQQAEQPLGIAQIARSATPAALFGIAEAAGSRLDGQSARPDSALDRLWIHSMAVAHTARHLSRERRYPHAETAFLAGLLHDLGLLAAVAIAPDLVARILKDASGAESSFAVEQELLGITHVAIGRRLGERWGLPLWLRNVAWWHHHPEETLPARLAHRMLVEVVRDAVARVARTDFALGNPGRKIPISPPWGSRDTFSAELARGIRLTTTFAQPHWFRDDSDADERWVNRILSLARENARLRCDLDWRLKAWANRNALPLDVSPAELTSLVAETFSVACVTPAVLCYVCTPDGTRAEGSFWSECPRPVECALTTDADHTKKVVACLPGAWQKRLYRVVELVGAEGAVGYVVWWPDELTESALESVVEQVTELTSGWMAQAARFAQLEEQLERVVLELGEQAARSRVEVEEAKLQALAEMAAGAGHEINNPLAVISGRAQLLLAEETDPRRRKALTAIAAQAQRIHRMIVDLMIFARPPEPDCKPVRVAEVVQRVTDAVRDEAQEAQIRLSTDVADGLPLVLGDMDQLTGALQCILQNSLDAVEREGDVRITAEPGPDGIVELCVSDDGPGIPEEKREHIFDPFYCGRESGRGVGLGLSKAWRIMQIHGGKMFVESGPAGTTVVVRLLALSHPTPEMRACA